MVEEQIQHSPKWLEYSGLPEFLNSEIRGGAWSVFKKLVERDCEQNSRPDNFEISVTELSRAVGLPPKTVRRIITGLRKKEMLVFFLPESDDEGGLFRINVPLPTPISAKEIKKKHSSIFPPRRDFFRYSDKRVIETDGSDPKLQELIDIYLNSIGLKINVFVIDELLLLKERFDFDAIKEAFAQAREGKTRNLRWVARKLLGEERKANERKKDKKTKKGKRRKS